MAEAPEIDGLFRLPLDEFTAARNALAAKLRKSGRSEEAEQVKAISKPQVSAWAINQLYWRHRKAFDRLIATGERFRKAQAAQLAGKASDLHAPLEARRQTLAELSRLAATTLRDAGHAAGPDMMRRVMTTLEALSSYGSHADAPQAGRLTDDIDPPGFEVIAALIPRDSRRGGSSGAAAGAMRVVPFPRSPAARATHGTARSAEEAQKERSEEHKRQRAAASSAVREAEQALVRARKAAADAEAALKAAAARAKEAEKEKTEIEKRLEKASAEADVARREARRVAADAENAAQDVEDAERALETARREREALSES